MRYASACRSQRRRGLIGRRFPRFCKDSLGHRETLQTRFASRTVQSFSTTTSSTYSCAWTTCSRCLPFIPLSCPKLRLDQCLSSSFSSSSMKFCDNCYTFLCYSVSIFLILLDWKDNAKVCPFLYTILIYFHNYTAIIFMNPFILSFFLYTVHLYARYQHIFRYNYTIIIDNNFVLLLM